MHWQERVLYLPCAMCLKGESGMEKYYEVLEMEIVLFSTDDIVRTSFGDNVTDFPDYPENFE